MNHSEVKVKVMHDIIREAINDPEAAWEIIKMDRNVTEVVDAVSDLSREDKIKLGATFKRFPLWNLIGRILSDRLPFAQVKLKFLPSGLRRM